MNSDVQVRVVQDTSVWDKINSISMVVTALFTVFLVIIAFIELRNLIKSNYIKTIIDLESELYQRKSKLDDISSKIRIEGENISKKMLTIYEDDLNAANENYFNVLDRLCYCILKGYLKDRDWESEYGDLIKETVRSCEADFGVATYYKNIKKLYLKWNDM